MCLMITLAIPDLDQTCNHQIQYREQTTPNQSNTNTVDNYLKLSKNSVIITVQGLGLD